MKCDWKRTNEFSEFDGVFVHCYYVWGSVGTIGFGEMR